MSKLETNTIDNISGSSTLTIGDSNASTISIPKNITLGASGTTITVPSGATITNNGTQTGFGGTNTPLFRAYSSTGQTLSNNTDTTIVFGAEEFDPQNTFASNTFTPGVSGKYFLKACVRMGNGADNGQNEIYLKKNSSVVAAVRLNNSGTGAFMLQISDIVTSDTNDAFTIVVYQNSGGNVTAESGSNQTWFTGFKIIE
jgi:hypothetical protein